MWKKSAELIYNKLHLTDSGFNELLTYKASFSKKSHAEIFNHRLFNNTIFFDIKDIQIKSDDLLDPNYIAEFTRADGSFSITKPSLVGKWPTLSC